MNCSISDSSHKSAAWRGSMLLFFLLISLWEGDEWPGRSGSIDLRVLLASYRKSGVARAKERMWIGGGDDDDDDDDDCCLFLCFSAE